MAAQLGGVVLDPGLGLVAVFEGLGLGDVGALELEELGPFEGPGEVEPALALVVLLVEDAGAMRELVLTDAEPELS